MNRSFVKSAGSESLKSLFKKEGMSKEQQERFALGHRRGKTVKNIRKIRIARFLPQEASFQSRNNSFLGCLCPTIYVASVNFSVGTNLTFRAPYSVFIICTLPRIFKH